MTRVHVWMLACVVVSMTVVADAQRAPAAATPPTNASAAPALSRELALEIDLQQTKEQLVQAQNDLAALRVQFNGLSKVLDEFLASEARPRIQGVLETRKAIEDKAIAALGGDPAKGDTFDWATKTLVRKDNQR